MNPQYAAWKARNYPGKGILVRTGAYFEAATTPHGAYNVIEIDDNSLTYGVEGLDYPSFHESGTNRLPARPVFALLENDADLEEAATEALSQFITDKFA